MDNAVRNCMSIKAKSKASSGSGSKIASQCKGPGIDHLVAQKQRKRRDSMIGVVEANQGLDGQQLMRSVGRRNGVSGDTTKG